MTQITKAQMEHLRCFIQPSVTTYKRPLPNGVTNVIYALLAIGDKLASGDWVMVPKEITKEMAWELENNFATPLPPSEIHRANWQSAYSAMLSAVDAEPKKE